MTVTANMIASINDTGYCLPSYPCCHNSFTLELKDGRRATVELKAGDIYSILKALRGTGVFHPDWGHFAYYKTIQEMGAEVRSASVVLTEIFKNRG